MTSESAFETKVSYLMEEEIPKVLLGGMRRSGTTFLCNFLNANDGCLFMRDSLQAVFTISKQFRIKSFTEILPIHIRNILLFTLKGEMSVFGLKQLDNLQAEQFSTLKELFDLASELFIDKTTKVFGVKVVDEDYWYESLMKDTDIKVIYIIRDLRDVLLSSSNAFASYDRKLYALKWYQGITKALQIKDPKMLVIRFEDLILNKAETVGKLSEFLGLDLDCDIELGKDVTGVVWGENSAFHDVKKLFDSTSVYRWKKNLDSKEVEYGSVMYKELMKKLGYEENRIPFFKSLKLKFNSFLGLKKMVIRNMLFLILVRKAIRFGKRFLIFLRKKKRRKKFSLKEGEKKK